MVINIYLGRIIMKKEKVIACFFLLLASLTSCASSAKSALKDLYQETKSSGFLGNPYTGTLHPSDNENEVILSTTYYFVPPKASYGYDAIVGVYFNEKGFDNEAYDVILDLERNEKDYFIGSSFLSKKHKMGTNAFYFDKKVTYNGFSANFDTNKALLASLASSIDKALAYIIDGYRETVEKDFKVLLPDF